eukprot:evm.model.NODE_31977_length_99932_cov_29.870142.2
MVGHNRGGGRDELLDQDQGGWGGRKAGVESFPLLLIEVGPLVVVVVVVVVALWPSLLVLVLAERVGEEAVEGEGVRRYPKALHQVSHL